MAFVFVTSWPLMVLFEPAGSPIVEPENYWWWFIVTGSTVGYGDFYPETVGGHVVGVYVIVGGIAALTTLFTQLANVIERARGRRMQGAITVDVADHVVVLGYTPGRTERIVHGMPTEGGRTVVLCAWDDVEAHPMPDRDVEFVRGDLTDVDVLRRAGVHRAYSVLVDARDDNEALAMAVSVQHLNPEAHLVVALRDMSRADHLKYVSESIRCVQWHMPRMATEELQDPGVTQVYMELMRYGGGNAYSMRLPDSMGGVTFGACQTAFGQGHDATVLAVRTSEGLQVSPSWSTELPAGSVLYYVGRERLEPGQIAGTVRKAAVPGA
ncbi:ion transporter [Actinobacteria bacterium YIM 96077]|uniref:Ion transporter n=2 Tax=Phytoactinopolyspora halophila TaxID=1981511 RepID=A0A329QKY0_9ACTN|nr:ion transporter [Actinobacteria bacterium YIM 96077]RAW11178.1 ion transporter [Phytoactinopolyspora halophila]